MFFLKRRFWSSLPCFKCRLPMKRYVFRYPVHSLVILAIVLALLQLLAMLSWKHEAKAKTWTFDHVGPKHAAKIFHGKVIGVEKSKQKLYAPDSNGMFKYTITY